MTKIARSILVKIFVECVNLHSEEIDYQFLSNLLEYDRGDSFPFNFEPNEIPFGSKSKGKLSPRSYPIQCKRKLKYSFLSVPSLRIIWGKYGLPLNISTRQCCFGLTGFRGSSTRPPWCRETLSRTATRQITDVFPVCCEALVQGEKRHISTVVIAIPADWQHYAVLWNIG